MRRGAPAEGKETSQALSPRASGPCQARYSRPINSRSCELIRGSHPTSKGPNSENVWACRAR